MRFLRTPLRWAAAAVLVAGTGCHDDGPTSPLVSVDEGLSGEWHGMASYSSGQCAAESVTATVTQRGSRVTATMRTACYGNLGFTLTISSSALTGAAAIRVTCLTLFGGTNAPLRSDASGTVSGAHIHLDAGAFPFPFGNCGRPGVTVELDR